MDESNCRQECRECRAALATLVDIYVENIGTNSEFISCITPPHASSMTYFERRKSEVWSAWDEARAVLGGKYVEKTKGDLEKFCPDMEKE